MQDIAAIEKAIPVAGDLDSQLKAARAEIDQCKLKLQYLAQYISKRAEMTFSALEMNRVEISLYRRGEIHRRGQGRLQVHL